MSGVLKTPEESRRSRAAELLADFDAFYVTSPHNVRYLTGFTGSNGAVLLFRDKRAVLVTDPRYTVQAQQQVNCEVRIAKGPLTKSVMKEIGRRRVAKVGYEPEHINLARFEGLKKALPDRSRLLPAEEGLIAKQRMVKDEGEIVA